jgi:hypothetical protein
VESRKHSPGWSVACRSRPEQIKMETFERDSVLIKLA